MNKNSMELKTNNLFGSGDSESLPEPYTSYRNPYTNTLGGTVRNILGTTLRTAVSGIVICGGLMWANPAAIWAQDNSVNTSPAANSNSVSGNSVSGDLTVLVERSIDPNTAPQAIAALRNEGYRGIAAFMSRYGSELRDKPQLRNALDAICQQKDCDSSQLYWYTDLEQAKAAARSSGKPILSLRLLGSLTDDLSCANSRFFRTALYPNGAVSSYLRDNYILHWQSERPVPKMTIDFGDGRTMQQTITGNSIHYILDSNGRPVEAIPGLYGATAFLQQLQQVTPLAKDVTKLADSEFQEAVRQYHRRQYGNLEIAWRRDLRRLRLPIQPLLPDPSQPNAVETGSTSSTTSSNTTSPNPSTNTVSSSNTSSSTTVINGSGTVRTASSSTTSVSTPSVSDTSASNPALVASQIGLTKSRVELPVLLRLPAPVEAKVPNSGEPSALTKLGMADWQRIASLHSRDGKLDENSVRLMQRKLGLPENLDEAGTNRLNVVRQEFEQNIALDTVRNEYGLHAEIHRWFAAGRVDGLANLNRRIYDELFLTPANDPWLGLRNNNVYLGMEER
jgi:hypothetical protein